MLNIKTKTNLIAAINANSVFAYPTEAVFGLGCHPWDQQAVTQVLTMKQRPIEKGLIIVTGQIEHVEPILSQLSSQQRAMVESSWPGPITWSLPNHHFVPDYVTGGRSTVAVRVSKHPVVAEITKFLGHPVVSTSANVTGQQPAKTYLKCKQYQRYFGQPLFVVPGSVGSLKNPTPIRDLHSGDWIRE